MSNRMKKSEEFIFITSAIAVLITLTTVIITIFYSSLINFSDLNKITFIIIIIYLSIVFGYMTAKILKNK